MSSGTIPHFQKSLLGLLEIISLHVLIVLSVCLKFSQGGHSPPTWLFGIQEGRQDGRNSKPKSTDDNNFHSECSKTATLLLRNMFSRTKNLIAML